MRLRVALYICDYKRMQQRIRSSTCACGGSPEHGRSATDEDIAEIRRLQELAEKIGNPGHLMSALMAAWTPWAEFSPLIAAWTPKEEFKFREEEMPNSRRARMPPALSWNSTWENSSPSLATRDTSRPCGLLGSHSSALVSLGILYQGRHG